MIQYPQIFYIHNILHIRSSTHVLYSNRLYPSTTIKQDTGKPDNLTGVQVGDLLIEPSYLDFGNIEVDQLAVSEILQIIRR